MTGQAKLRGAGNAVRTCGKPSRNLKSAMLLAQKQNNRMRELAAGRTGPRLHLPGCGPGMPRLACVLERPTRQTER